MLREAQRTAELQDAASASAKLQEQVERLKSEASQAGTHKRPEDDLKLEVLKGVVA